jgi:hypothetical protein
MLIRMTSLGILAALLGAGSLAIGGLLGWGSTERSGSPARTALVVDAAAGRDGRDLVDPRLRVVDAEIRLPRTPSEAATNVRYFDKQGYRVVVAGPRAAAAAAGAGVRAVREPNLAGALALLAR